MSSITLPIESGTIGEKEFGDGQKNENISPYNNTPQLASGTTSISGGDTQIDNEKNLAKQLEEQPARNLHGIKWALVVISILWATFLFALDNTIVADVQPAIIETFGDISKLSWMAGAFLLGAASTNLIWWVVMSRIFVVLQSLTSKPGVKSIASSTLNGCTWFVWPSSKLAQLSVVQPTRRMPSSLAERSVVLEALGCT